MTGNNRAFVLTIISFLASIPTAIAECPNPLPQTPKPEDLRACFAEIAALRSDIERLQRAGSGGAPVRAVMAFDLPSCPTGWSMFKPATDRVIIGEGKEFDVGLEADQFGRTLKPQGHRDHGGEQVHQLTLDEMPPHDHPIQILEHSEYLRENRRYHGTDAVGRDTSKTNNPQWSVRYTEVVGGEKEVVGHAKPHNVMPPFIALLYCKKD